MPGSRVSQLFLKPDREHPMARQTFLDLDPRGGIAGSLPTGLPRQVNLATVASLQAHNVSPEGARVNLVIDSGPEKFQSGTRVTIGEVELRISFPCEPCAHGARLAGVPLVEFRQLDRSLAVVITPGRITDGDTVTVEEGIYPHAPADFRARTAWALDQIPLGKVVRSTEFLSAIGGSRSYQRALPGWLRHAVAEGRPGHRVLPADLTPPSWSSTAGEELANEGLSRENYGLALWPLASALWGSGDLS